MTDYKVIFSKRAEKELDKLPKRIVLDLLQLIEGLETNPRPVGSKKLSGYFNCHRVRRGDYRVVYTIEDDILTIEIVRVGHRKDIYD